MWLCLIIIRKIFCDVTPHTRDIFYQNQNFNFVFLMKQKNYISTKICINSKSTFNEGIPKNLLPSGCSKVKMQLSHYMKSIKT